MEVKCNKEIRSFSESIFFGLSLRQFVFSILAVGIAILLYFLLRPLVGTEEVGWMCIIGALPFGMFGFFKYQDLPLEKFLWYFIKSQFIMPRRLGFSGENALIAAMRRKERESGRKPKIKLSGGKSNVSNRA